MSILFSAMGTFTLMTSYRMFKLKDKGLGFLLLFITLMQYFCATYFYILNI